MEYCFAPSEIGASYNECRIFGALAEDIIHADLASRYSRTDMYVDNYNLGGYLYFLSKKNPSLELLPFATVTIRSTIGLVRPDFLIHTSAQRIFYEVKPGSKAGVIAGKNKVVKLAATYDFNGLPYKAGASYQGNSLRLAFGPGFSLKLVSSLLKPGLIVYKVCIEHSGNLDTATTLSLRYVIQKLNEQAGSKTFKPVDLGLALRSEGSLPEFGRKLGIIVKPFNTIPWRFFWKAVAKRFAHRGATALVLSATDGPMPVGELISLGIGIYTVFEIVLMQDVLWEDAAILRGK